MGVDDATRAIIGVRSVKYATDNLIQAARSCVPSITFDPPEPEVILVNSHRLVVAHIPPHPALVQAGGVFWQRRSSLTVPLTLPEISARLYSRNLVPWERQPSPATLEDLEQQQVTTYLAARSPTMLQHSSTVQALVGLEAAIHVPERGTVPTNAGLLMFGRHPQVFLRQAEVDVVEWRAPGEPAGPEGRGGWADRRRLEGPLPDLIEGAIHFVASHIPTSARIVGAYRQDSPAYPLEAIREAIVNAIVHRDYSLDGQAVRVFIYPSERIEVRSPGRLMPDVTLDLLIRGEPLSKPRNPLLVDLLRNWPGKQYMERLGAGIRLMLGAMREAGLAPPGLSEVGDEFVVRFYGPGVSPPNAVQPPVTAPTSAPYYPLPSRPVQLENKQQHALEYVRTQGRIDTKQYCALANVPERTGRHDLKKLADLGLLVRRGAGRTQHYVLPDPHEP
jgi:ATP-dependent DNA helicase RecG